MCPFKLRKQLCVFMCSASNIGLEKSYDASVFQELGMIHIQAPYDDTHGGVPPKVHCPVL